MTTIPQFEQTYVVDVYNTNSKRFDSSRYTRWMRVEEFINSIPNSSILEIGCGNGKNMFNRTRKDSHPLSYQLHTAYQSRENFPCHQWTGCDASSELVKCCIEKNLAVVEADMCNLPFKNGEFDVVLCIAVLHHLSTEERRITALREIARILKPNGIALVSVLSEKFELKPNDVIFSKANRDVSFKFENTTRYYHLFTRGEFNHLADELFTIKNFSDEYDNYYFTLERK
jgi:alkylated DNA repair protein alkB homolog 8